MKSISEAALQYYYIFTAATERSRDQGFRSDVKLSKLNGYRERGDAVPCLLPSYVSTEPSKADYGGGEDSQRA